MTIVASVKVRDGVVPDAAAVREFPPPDRLIVGGDCEGAEGCERSGHT